MYGWRARIGRLAPSAASVAENEWAKASPDGVITVCARYLIERVTVADLENMMSQVDRAAREVASAKVNVIAQCGTPGIFIRGHGYDREVIDRIQELTGIQATTMMTSVVESLRRLGARRLAVATAYTDDLNELLRTFLEASGFEVLSMTGLGLVRNVDIAEQPPEVAYRIGKRAFNEAPGADALFISCGGLRTFEAIEPLEGDFGRPVTSSSLATFWNCLRMSGVGTPITGFGTLLTLSGGER
jgi:maleate cis-trans isomerase